MRGGCIDSCDSEQTLPPLLSPIENRRTVLSQRPKVLLTILASEQTTKFGLQRSQRRRLPFAERATGRGKRRAHPERRGGGDLLGEVGGPIQLLAGSGYFLHESHAVGLV